MFVACSSTLTFAFQGTDSALMESSAGLMLCFASLSIKGQINRQQWFQKYHAERKIKVKTKKAKHCVHDGGL